MNFPSGKTTPSIRGVNVVAVNTKAPKGAGLDVLYLDFDGVLHHENCLWHPKRGLYLKAPEGHVLFQHASLLAEMLAPYPSLKIVLSTSWVRSYGCEKAAKRLPAALRDRVIGATWHSAMKPLENEWVSRPRGMQVWGDVDRRMPRAWLALDDDHRNWPAWALDNYIRTDDVLGISHPEVTPLIRQKLDQLFGQGELP
jgi:hypothetical protein